MRTLHLDGDSEIATVAIPLGENIVELRRMHYKDMPVDSGHEAFVRDYQRISNRLMCCIRARIVRKFRKLEGQ